MNLALGNWIYTQRAAIATAKMGYTYFIITKYFLCCGALYCQVLSIVLLIEKLNNKCRPRGQRLEKTELTRDPIGNRGLGQFQFWVGKNLEPCRIILSSLQFFLHLLKPKDIIFAWNTTKNNFQKFKIQRNRAITVSSSVSFHQDLVVRNHRFCS